MTIANQDHESRLQRIERYLPRIQLRIPVQQQARQRVKITGGQMVNGISVIQYAADPFTTDRAYNANTDTAYIVGLGYGQLFNSYGQLMGNVIVRHKYTQFTGSLIAGQVYTVGPPITLPTPASAGPPAVAAGTMLVYPIIDG